MNDNKKTITISVSITPEARERLKAIAAENHVTVSAQIARWLWDYKLKDEKESK